MSSKNTNIINEFTILCDGIKNELLYPKKSTDINTLNFKLRAFERALETFSKFKTEIKSVEQIDGIPNIGPGIKKRVQIILTKGYLPENNKYKKQETDQQYINELTTLIGIGPQLALKLIHNHNIKSISELERKINDIPLPHMVKVGLKYKDKYEKKIPRLEMVEIDKYIHSILIPLDSDLLCVLCGSYRRLKTYSNDIDMLIVHPQYNQNSDILKSNLLEKIIKTLSDQHLIIESLLSQDVKTRYMGLIKMNRYPIRKLDIRLVPYTSYYTALLYFTGSAQFNKYIRTKAKRLGYKLSEYGLFKYSDDKWINIPIHSEHDVFNYLKLPYQQPQYR
jgi:DNA polymerase/3'-5' exonuclease PolX